MAQNRNDQNGVPLGAIALGYVDETPTVPFTPPVEIAEGTPFEDTFAYANVAALNASGYNDADAGYSLVNVTAIGPGLAITPGPEDESDIAAGVVALPFSFETPVAAMWARVRVRMTAGTAYTTGQREFLRLGIYDAAQNAGAQADITGGVSAPLLTCELFGPDDGSWNEAAIPSVFTSCLASLVVYVERLTAASLRLVVWFGPGAVPARLYDATTTGLGTVGLLSTVLVRVTRVASESGNAVDDGVLNVERLGFQAGALAANPYGVLLP